MTPKEKLELLRSYRTVGGTGSYASLLREVRKFDGGGERKRTFLQPNDPKLPPGKIHPLHYQISTERASSIGGEHGEPAYLIPTFKYGKPLEDPVAEFNNTGEHLGGPFKTWQEAEKFGELRHKYVEKGEAIPSPIMTWGKEYAEGGPKKKLPELPLYYNQPQIQDNIVRQYNPITNPDERFIAEEKERQLRIAQREKELQKHYSQPRMVSGMKRKPTPSEIRAHAESSVAYNDRVKNDPVGTFGPDIALSLIPELMMLKVPQQAIGRGLNKLNPFKGSNPWSKVSDIPTPKFISEIDWAKWNPEIPTNKPLMQEYHAIEKAAKRNGTWMKNPDGYAFKGTPEQFVQQRSSRFKKYIEDAGGNYEEVLNDPFFYHGSKTKNIQEFHTPQHPNYKKATGDTPETGIFITRDKGLADIYASQDIWENTKSGLNWKGNKKIGETYQLYAPANYGPPGLRNPNNILTTSIGTKVEKPILTGNIDLKDVQYLKDLGYSGLKSSVRGEGTERVIFNPQNIKSAIGNNGMFDMTNPNIYKALLPVGLGTGLYNKTINN